jgi:hypothetical protein
VGHVCAPREIAGIGRQLIEAVIDYARHHVELIQLSVVSDNERARRLYAGLGFVEYGVEKSSLKQRGRYYDEILMALDLMREPDRHAISGSRPAYARNSSRRAWDSRSALVVAHRVSLSSRTSFSAVG